MKLFSQGTEYFLLVEAGQVGFVYEYKYRDTVPLKQLPKGTGVGLNPSADDKYGIIQHLKGALGLGGKVHMAGSIQQCYGIIPKLHYGLLGEYGYAPLLFKAVCIQKSGLMIHPAYVSKDSCRIQQSFGQGGFAGIHVGQHAYSNVI